jgi:succinoglycan biosynthesis transport protein ExoP
MNNLMLQSNNEHLISSEHLERPQSASLAALIGTALGFLRRQYWVIFSPLLLSMTLGIGYLMKTPPSFTASASMMIDPQAKTGGSQSLQAVLGDTPIDFGWIESQISIIKSDTIASSVIKELRLTEDPEFVGGEGQIHKLLAALVKQKFWHGSEASKPPSDADLMRKAISIFKTQLDVQRLGAYVIQIDFTSPDPDRAAQIANAVSSAYIRDQLDVKYRASQRASDWLQQRLQTLHAQATSAERDVIEFKAKNNIVAAGGKLMNEQELADLNSQLVAARTRTSEAQAKLSRIQAVFQAEQSDESAHATVSDTLNNPVITKLRSQYLELVNREADWSRRYGRNHLAVVNLRNQIKEIRGSILDELERIAETYKSNYAIAKHAEEDLEKRLADSVTGSQGANQALVVLRGLESSAQTYRTLYDNFLQRYTESVQQQSFPVTEARLISPADGAIQTSRSRALKVLAVVLVGGVGCGAGLALLRELLDGVFRTSDQIQSALNADCLALVPRTLSDFNPFRVVIESPFSRFSEAIRTIKLAADLAGDPGRSKVIAFTSALPGEGKSTVAGALAQLIAQVGSTVILVDCDLRNPTLSRTLAPEAGCGFVDVVLGTKSLELSILKHSVTNMTFLPAGKDSHLSYTAEILGSGAAKSLFDKLRQSYNYVIVDLSPLAPVVDARATTQLVDAYVMIVKWGSTKIDVVQHGLNTAPGVQNNLLGVVLNQTDFDLLKLYEGHKEQYYHEKYVARYEQLSRPQRNTHRALLSRGR